MGAVSKELFPLSSALMMEAVRSSQCWYSSTRQHVIITHIIHNMHSFTTDSEVMFGGGREQIYGILGNQFRHWPIF
jgi:hypothetical protein